MSQFTVSFTRCQHARASSRFVVMQNYFEGIGVLVQRGLIDLQLVNDLLWNITMYFWEKYYPFYKELRQRRGQEQIADHTEYLYNRIKALNTPS